MAVKVYLVLCALAVLVQTITAQCIGNAASVGVSNIGIVGHGIPSINFGCGNGLNLGVNGLNLGAAGLNYGSALNLGAPVNGGGFIVTSSSPIAPSTVSVVSENQFEGPVNVFGALPFLAAAALEGQMQSGGGAGVTYSCGNGNIGIISENAATPAENYGGISGLGAGISYGFPLASAGLGGASLAGCGLGGASLAGCGLGGASLAGCGLGGASLAGCGLGGASLASAGLGGASLAGCGLGGASLAGCGLGGASLASAGLGGASLAGCGLGGASLAGCGLAAPVLAAPVAPIGGCGCGIGY